MGKQKGRDHNVRKESNTNTLVGTNGQISDNFNNTGARNHRESIPKIGKRIICLKTLSNKKRPPNQQSWES